MVIKFIKKLTTNSAEEIKLPTPIEIFSFYQ
jgi:hypothetical protein